MEQTSGASVLAFVALLAFAIDRLVAGLLFVMSWFEHWRHLCPDPSTVEDPREKADATRAQKTAYFVLAGLCSVGVYWAVDKGVLQQLGVQGNAGRLDGFLTILILMGGAERVSAFTKTLSSGDTAALAPPDPPVQITGTLLLEEGTVARLRGREGDRA